MNDGGEAFPRATYLAPSVTDENATAYNVHSVCGMSLRDWFAGHALTGLLAHPTTDIALRDSESIAARVGLRICRRHVESTGAAIMKTRRYFALTTDAGWVPGLCFHCGRTVSHPKKYCDLSCFQASAEKRVIPRFWSKVLRASGDGCWLWQGTLDRKGYGQFHDRSCHHVFAHRVSYALAHGPLPEGAQVLHRCDNPPCVRPDHLFLGDHLANMRDAANKLKFGSWKRKLSDSDLTEIRAIGYSLTAKALGEKYGVSIGTIARVRQFQSRKGEVNWKGNTKYPTHEVSFV